MHSRSGAPAFLPTTSELEDAAPFDQSKFEQSHTRLEPEENAESHRQRSGI